jgi:hypothetical protein
MHRDPVRECRDKVCECPKVFKGVQRCSKMFVEVRKVFKGVQRCSLEVAHNAESQAARLRPALQARNMKMAGPGQEAWNHACELCCWVFKDENRVFCMFIFFVEGCSLTFKLYHC